MDVLTVDVKQLNLKKDFKRKGIKHWLKIVHETWFLLTVDVKQMKT